MEWHTSSKIQQAPIIEVLTTAVITNVCIFGKVGDILSSSVFLLERPQQVALPAILKF